MYLHTYLCCCFFVNFYYFLINFAYLGSPLERVLPEDWDHFYVLLREILHRIPLLGNAVLQKLTNGPEAFSPDCRWILGEAPEVCIQIN